MFGFLLPGVFSGNNMISYIVFGIAVIFYALSQSIMHGKAKDEGKGKYKLPLEPGKGMYYSLFGITYRERFWGSATIFAALTDKYHACQFIFKIGICAAIVLHKSWLGYFDALVYWVEFGIIFTVAYKMGSRKL